MNDTTNCTCPSGDGSLRHPCPRHVIVTPGMVELDAWDVAVLEAIIGQHDYVAWPQGRRCPLTIPRLARAGLIRMAGICEWPTLTGFGYRCLKRYRNQQALAKVVDQEAARLRDLEDARLRCCTKLVAQFARYGAMYQGGAGDRLDIEAVLKILESDAWYAFARSLLETRP